ncbi:fibrohexamerin-like [Bombyx mandarina]|uniref:Fibrohexamerin-like n=1 Tax=Bombyx mandarina TaxID=7092 RepID=A0A6J2JAJ2_BOMMA|nr:fibrohexamerin-like [Bombyx mandarina]
MKYKLCLFLSSLLNLIAAKTAPCEELDPADVPCPNFGLDCIREYFSKNSQCQIVYGPVPDPLYYGHYKVDIPNSNVTLDFSDVNVGGLNGNIVEFYINTETQKLVLAIETPSLRLYTEDALFQYNRKAKEPIERSDYLEVKYGRVTFTAVFHRLHNLDLSSADVNSYVENASPQFELGPCIDPSSDTEAQNEFRKLMSSFRDDLRELFSLQGQIFMTSYIQYNICDFGC